MNKLDFIKHAFRGGGVVGAAVVIQFIVGFGVQVTLTRMLEPEVFGQIAFAAAVGMLLNSLTDAAGDKYVIQSSENSRNKLDSVFTLELILALFFVVLVFIIAPFAMAAIDKPDSTLLVQVLAFAYFYNPLVRPRCIFEKDLNFLRAKLPIVVSQVVCGVITIFLAWSGFGIWSLVFWRLSVLFCEVLILWAIAMYRPKLAWNTELVRGGLNFGWPLMCAGFLGFFAQNISYLFIGALDNSDELSGYYWLAFQFSVYFLKVREIIYSVLFPIFSRIESSGSKAELFERITKAVSGLFILPVLVAVYFAHELILTIFGEKWEPSVIPFQIIFLTTLIRAINSNVGYFLQSQGITNAALTAVSVNLIFLLPSGFILSQKYGINGMAYAVLMCDCIAAYVVYERFIRPLTNYGFWHFFSRPLLVSSGAYLSALLVQYFDLGFIYKLSIFIMILVFAYFLILKSPCRDVLQGFKMVRANRSSA